MEFLSVFELPDAYSFRDGFKGNYKIVREMRKQAGVFVE